MLGKREDGESPATKPERSLKRLFVLSFGLLCVLQVSLNVSLRLILYSQLQTSYNSLADEHQRLRSECSNMMNEQQQLQNVVDNMTNMADDVLTKLRETKLQMERSKVNISVEHMLREDDDDRQELEDSLEGCDNLTQEHDLLQTQPVNLTNGCIYFNGSYYFTCSKKLTWPHSRLFCLQRKAELITISSAREQEFASRLQKPAWIGLTDWETEGQWTWVDGTPLTTQYWMESEPNDDPDVDEDCAEITNTDETRSWNDASCRQEKFCICEMQQT